MKTMLITGVSSGLGRALAAEALRQGWRVAGTVRKEEDRVAFEASRPGQAFARLLDVRDAARTTEVVREIEQTVGPIDVLVNNAGYGLWSTIEEAPLDEIREQFAVNVLGQVAMLQAVLPGMRTRRAGRVLNITSMGGLTAFPLVGIYNATKFAMEGITEALRQEVAEFGILVTAVEPGMFKTDWAGRSLRHGPEMVRDYDGLRKRQAERELQWNGDVVKAGKAMLTILEEPNPPGHLLLGTIANELVEKKLETLRGEIDAYREMSAGTDEDA